MRARDKKTEKFELRKLIFKEIKLQTSKEQDLKGRLAAQALFLKTKTQDQAPFQVKTYLGYEFIARCP